MGRAKVTEKNAVLQVCPKPPEGLGEIASEHWTKTAKILISEKILKSIDLPILEMACRFWEKYLLADKLDNLTEARKASDQYLKIMKSFGATYESSQKLKLEKKVQKITDEDSMFEDW